MTCREFVDFLMRYLDGELGPEQSATFRQHMEACPPCVHYLETYRETIRLGREVCVEPDGPVPKEVPEELVTAILSARRR